MTFFKKAMNYLGLGPDDAYDDYDAPMEPERPNGRAARPGYGPDPLDSGTVRTVRARSVARGPHGRRGPRPRRRPRPRAPWGVRTARRDRPCPHRLGRAHRAGLGRAAQAPHRPADP